MSIHVQKNMRFQVFKSRLQRSDSTPGSHNESGSEIQTVEKETEKAGCQICCDETVEYL